jgi:hypothetical protein
MITHQPLTALPHNNDREVISVILAQLFAIYARLETPDGLIERTRSLFYLTILSQAWYVFSAFAHHRLLDHARHSIRAMSCSDYRHRSGLPATHPTIKNWKYDWTLPGRIPLDAAAMCPPDWLSAFFRARRVEHETQDMAVGERVSAC